MSRAQHLTCLWHSSRGWPTSIGKSSLSARNRTMSPLSQITDVLAPVHRDGHKFIALGALLALLGFLIWSPLGWLFAFLTLAVAFFFRDPERVTPLREGLIVAPADGKVIAVEDAPPPPELELGAEPMACISVFLSLLDVHITRTPVSGRIAHIGYVPGAFHAANAPEAKRENERQGFTIEAGNGVRIGVVQVAGYVARRIVKFVEAGDRVNIGERLGLIRFGSRVDIYLPLSAAILTAEGQRTLGGETVIADLEPGEARRSFRKG
jgi:phosphatidylserine decarboxylase